jgi:hypothetical protein
MMNLIIQVLLFGKQYTQKLRSFIKFKIKNYILIKNYIINI